MIINNNIFINQSFSDGRNTRLVFMTNHVTKGFDL